MSIRLKTKFTLGLVFLFIIIFAFGTLGIFHIYRLSSNARLILDQNHNSQVYSNNMLQALEEQPAKLAALEKNLVLQEKNVTEAGEGAVTAAARNHFKLLQQHPGDNARMTALRQDILQIVQINQQAIILKNRIAAATAANAIVSLSIILLLLTIVSIVFIISFPRIITHPIQLLSMGIREISNKNYNTRIHLTQHDEFGELAAVFNMMAGKLHEYEHGNLARIRFEKTRIEAIINQMKDGIIGFDEQRNILFMNAVAARFFGIDEQPLINNISGTLEQHPLLKMILEHPAHKQLKINSDGQTGFYMKDIITVTNNQDVIGEVMVLRDITAFQELAAAKTQFIATISHELKTPISAMKMSLSLLNDDRVGTLQSEQQELLESIGEDVERMLKISSELLDMAQEETFAHETYPVIEADDIKTV
ncbi:PAS domain-containing protein [Chitinophaga niastensis]|uniref:histidine kinase n=1 Tax=Chitinophaga niastensis TaxID=536980 RepID=A0A2P8HGK7_CHINA|nr:histidine kinase dimerization/phospho-acceptor domain-containing protein [Chitinophaga niastensis]PSL45330.1 PAS domain-containing protein [Chitinophaga niastensis]